MTHKQNAYPPNLSGGQKRKLQLMISLVGNSKIILLDEPSSGMDPNSRRDTWNILKKLKKDKIIVLTTHYMDEAEVLGDRIAIVSHGKL
jgi:ATP-binding cassette subfamily A (ABC1) protein 3